MCQVSNLRMEWNIEFRPKAKNWDPFKDFPLNLCASNVKFRVSYDTVNLCASNLKFGLS